MRRKAVHQQSFTQNDSRNEFMGDMHEYYPSQPQKSQAEHEQPKLPDGFEKVYNFMTKVMHNPQLMNSYMSQRAEDSRITYQHEQIQKEVVMEEKQYTYKPKMERRKEQPSRRGTDVLSRYLPKTENQHPNQLAQSTVTVQEEIQPIKQQSLQPQTTSNPYDQIPIKSNYIESMQNSVNQMSSFNPNANLSGADDERPIKGISGNFKEHLRQLEGIGDVPEENIEEEIEENKQPPTAKPFLKRGTRQYLSSAKNRSTVKPKKKQQQETDVGFDKSFDNIEPPKKQNRSISQNRILNKKRTEKSISKPLPPKSTTSKHQTSYSEAVEEKKNPTPTPRQNKDTDRYNSNPSYYQSEVQPSPKKVTKKKKTNIFEDDSSSQNEEATTYHTKSMGSLAKEEVIPGVFLTKRQLGEILRKHGKSNPTTNYDQEKIKQLRKKYTDLCNVLGQEKKYFEKQMQNQRNALQRQRQEFQSYKNTQLTKIKNQKRIQQRQFQNRQTLTQNNQKQKQDLEAMKKQVEKQREDYKRKEKNNRIIIEKYKKEVDELKSRISMMSIEEKKVEKVKQGFHYKEPAQKKEKEEINRKATNKGKQTEREESEERYEFNSRKKTDSQRNKAGARFQTEGQKSEVTNYKPMKNSMKAKYDYRQEYNVFNEKIKSQKSSQSEEEEEVEQIVEYTPSMKLSDLTKIPLTIKMVTEEMIENMFRYELNSEYLKYDSIVKGTRQKVSTTRNAIERKLTNIYKDGGKQVIFETGVKKEYFSNGYSIIFFNNGDIKQKLTDGTVLYFYRERQVDQITLPNNINIYRFENNQIQFHFDNGHIEIRHPDGSIKVI